MTLLHQCVDANAKTSPNFLLQFLSYIQLTSMRSPDRDQVIILRLTNVNNQFQTILFCVNSIFRVLWTRLP